MDYKLIVHPALEAGNPHKVFMYETKEQMARSRDDMADLLIFLQDQAKLMPDYSNMFIGMYKDGLDWVEIEGF